MHLVCRPTRGIPGLAVLHSQLGILVAMAAEVPNLAMVETIDSVKLANKFQY